MTKERNNVYIILSDLKLLITQLSGNIDKDDLIRFSHKVLKDRSFNADYDMIADIRGLNIRINENEIIEYLNHLRPYFNKKSRTAFITNTPDQVVAGVLYGMCQGNNSLYTKVFSVLEEALDWLSLSDEINRIENILKPDC